MRARVLTQHDPSRRTEPSASLKRPSPEGPVQTASPRPLRIGLILTVAACPESRSRTMSQLPAPVGRPRRLAMASAGAVFRDRQAALAEIDRRLIENPTDPTLISTALRSQPEQFGHFLCERRLGRDDAQRTRAK